MRKTKRVAGQPIERPSVTFELRATVQDMGLSGLRVPIGEASANVPGIGKTKIEVSAAAPGSVMVIVTTGEGDTAKWRTFEFSVEDIARAAIEKVRAFPIT